MRPSFVAELENDPSRKAAHCAQEIMSQGTKRKWHELGDDDSDEEPSFGRQILPVADLPNDYGGIPQDGMEYLFTVRRDARTLPHVTRVPNPYEFPEPSHPPLATPPKPPHSALPSEEWRKTFERRFRNFRINTVQPTIHVHLPESTSRRVMPDKRERDLWWAFLEGRPESEWDPQTRLKAKKNSRKQKMRAFSDDESTHADEEPVLAQETWHINDQGEVELISTKDASELPPAPETPAPTEMQETITFQGSVRVPREPTPSLLRRIDHRMSMHLLMYFTHWIDVHLREPGSPSRRMTETHARWIFGLLTRVDDHLTANDTSLLRNLARACLALIKDLLSRSSPASEPADVPQLDIPAMSEQSCWMNFTVIAGVWGQRDLWSEAESMVSGLEAA